MNQSVKRYLAILLALIAGLATVSGWAEGTTEREKTMLRYKDCKWTDEMGRYVYECVKRQNGFGVHWCHDEAVQIMCPEPTKPKS